MPYPNQSFHPFMVVSFIDFPAVSSLTLSRPLFYHRVLPADIAHVLVTLTSYTASLPSAPPALQPAPSLLPRYLHLRP